MSYGEQTKRFDRSSGIDQGTTDCISRGTTECSGTGNGLGTGMGDGISSGYGEGVSNGTRDTTGFDTYGGFIGSQGGISKGSVDCRERESI